MHRVAFAARLDSPLARLTQSDGVRAEGHFLGRALLVRVEGPGAPRKLRASVARAGARVEPAEDASFLVHGALPERALADAVERAGGVVLPPLQWARGAVRLEALQLRPQLAEAVRRRVPEAEVVGTGPSRSAEEELRKRLPMPSLTRKQAEAILAALDAGYYDVPRRVTTLDVARKLGVARSTFEEHLKKAEGQFVGALAPLARLRLLEGEALEGEAVQLYARYSAALGLFVTMAVRGDRVARVQLAEAAPAGAEKEHPYLARLLEHLATGHGDLDGIPLDLQVSDFERQVLEAMRRIPAGQTMTYGELARRLGKPGAARAVGNACAHNPVPLIVPCHRVVPSDGSLGNYSALGGARTKAKLLELEGARPAED